MIALLALAAGLAVTGCGERTEVRGPGAPVPVRIAVAADAGDASVYAAEAGGHFKTAGLDVTLVPVQSATQAIALVQSGKVDLAVASEPALLEQRAGGARVVSVAALVRSPLTALVRRRQDRARSVLDLVAKPIGVGAEDYEREIAKTIIENQGGQPKVVEVPDRQAALDDGDVSGVIAQLGSPTLEPGLPVQLVDRFGVPPFSDYILVAGEDALGRDAGRIRSVIAALARGTRKSELEKVDRPGVKEALQGVGVDTVRGFMLPIGDRPYGWQEPSQWRKFAAWMRSRGLKERSQGAFTNRFLPGQGS